MVILCFSDIQLHTHGAHATNLMRTGIIRSAGYGSDTKNLKLRHLDDIFEG